MRQCLRLYLEAWSTGVKTIYYVRSKALEVILQPSCEAACHKEDSMMELKKSLQPGGRL